jgi:hypothetical protein
MLKAGITVRAMAEVRGEIAEWSYTTNARNMSMAITCAESALRVSSGDGAAQFVEILWAGVAEAAPAEILIEGKAA